MSGHLQYLSTPFSSTFSLFASLRRAHSSIPSLLDALLRFCNTSARRPSTHGGRALSPPPPPFGSIAFHSSKPAPGPTLAVLFDPSDANRLADSHLKSGRARDALHVLGEIPHPNLASWTLMISCYNHLSQFEDSFWIFRTMRSLGFQPDLLAFGNVVAGCAASQRLEFAEHIYALVTKNGFLLDGYICAGMISLFAKHGRSDDALKVLWEGDTANLVCWNAVIAGGVQNGEISVALDLFCWMVDGFCMPNGFTFSSILSACASSRNLYLGQGIHAWVIKCLAGMDVFVGTAIVDLYAKCGDMDAALQEFSCMPVRNVVSWTAIISGFVQQEKTSHALIIFKNMLHSTVKVNEYTLTNILLACSKSSMVNETSQIHCLIRKGRLYTVPAVKDALISTYAKLGNIDLSEKLFEETDTIRSPSTWSAMICGLAQTQFLGRALEMFSRMLHEGLRPDNKCCSVILSIVDWIDVGRQIHSLAIKDGSAHDVHTGSALFTMYSKCGSLEDSFKFFRRMPERDKVSWTSMISGFVKHGCPNEAFKTFREMLHEGITADEMSISFILSACKCNQFLMEGKELHGYVLRHGLVHDQLLAGALVSMYLKCKSKVSARRVFDGISWKDQSLWSSLVSGYASNGYSKEALTELKHMVNAGFEIDQFTCSSALGVCASLSRPAFGRQLHSHSVKAGIMPYLSVSSALLMLYSKCGSIDESRRVFNEIEDPDLVAWTTIIDACAQHGSGSDALKMFEMMKEKGIKPDSVILVSLLSACSHNGLLEEGFSYFNSMSTEYGIEPEACHYACMVDLLGRSGKLKEAADLIGKMPIEPDLLVWSTLLGACRVHGDVDLGKVAANKVLELEPRDSGTFISLSNISADMGEWEKVLMIRSSMEGVGVRKEPGWSTT